MKMAVLARTACFRSSEMQTSPAIAGQQFGQKLLVDGNVAGEQGR